MGKNPTLPRSKQYSSAGAGPRGGMLNNPIPRRNWEVCTVWDYSPQSQTYDLLGGSTGRIPDVQRLVADPGEVGILPRYTTVVVHYELGFPVISSVIKMASTNAVEVNPARVSEVRGVGGEDGVYSQRGTPVNLRPANDPIDVIAGDWIRKGKNNNMVGVLEGGSNVMSSSPMAQIRTHSVGDKNMVEVMADIYRHISSLGNLNIQNDGGKTSLIWRAGADQLTENGANAENWTLRLDAGATGDLFRLKVTTPNNNTLCELHMSADGRLSLTGVGGIDLSSGTRGTAREDVAENKEVSVLGAMVTTVGGNVSETFNAGLDTLVATNASLSTGNDLKEVVGHDRLTQISNKLTTTVEGGPSTPPPEAGNIAVLWDVVNGGVETVVGNPSKGGLPSVKPPFSVVNYGGSVNVAIQSTAQGGKFNLISNTDDSVLLGASGAATPDGKGGHTFTAIATQHVAKYEPFEDMMNTLLDWLDKHEHLTAMGPTGPASAGPSGPASLAVKPKLIPVKSTRVLIGS